MSFQDTRTPQYPEMQKQKPYGWLRNHPQKPADSRQNTGITKNPVGHSSQYGQVAPDSNRLSVWIYSVYNLSNHDLCNIYR